MKPVKHWLLLVRSSNLNKTGLDIYAKAALGNQELLFLFLFHLFFMIIFLLLRYT